MRKFLFLSSMFLILAGFAASASFQFERDLYFGIKNDSDVSRLQEFLTDKGYYTGPITGNFFSLTKAAVAAFQKSQNIEPAAGYFGSKSRVRANEFLTQVGEKSDTQKILEALLAQVQSLQIRLAETRAAEEAAAATPAPAPAPIIPKAVPNLRIAVTYPSITLGRYTNATLHELQFFAENPEDTIAVTRIKFTNKGTLTDASFQTLKLVESASGRELARINFDEGLAVVGGIADGVVEFVIKKDSNAVDNGFMVSGKTYAVTANLLTPNTTELPYVRLDIISSGDVDAFDAADLTRKADVTKLNIFPITGPRITMPVQ